MLDGATVSRLGQHSGFAKSRSISAMLAKAYLRAPEAATGERQQVKGDLNNCKSFQSLYVREEPPRT